MFVKRAFRILGMRLFPQFVSFKLLCRLNTMFRVLFRQTIKKVTFVIINRFQWLILITFVERNSDYSC